MNNEQDLSQLKAEDEDRQIKQQKKESVKLSKKSRKSTLPIIIMLIILIFGGYYLIHFLRNSSDIQKFLYDVKGKAVKQQTHEPQENTRYQNVDPNVSISPIPTQSTLDLTEESERVVIPGDVTDQLEEQIINAEEAASNIIKPTESELQLEQNLPEKNYTIQLLKSNNLNDLLEFVKQYQLINYNIYNINNREEKQYILIKGNFTSKEDAEKALSQLPKNIPPHSLQIKTGIDIKNEKK